MPPKDKKKKKPLHEYPPHKVTSRLYTHVGMDSTRTHSVHMLDDSVLISCAANTVQFVNIATGNITCAPGPADGGIGAVCVHPSRRYYAVCEKRFENPLALVYEYPSKKVKATLKNGAVRGYSACRFNDEGTYLATVAIEPDYVLTIWAWETEAIVLRNKAFGADVYNVAFNPFNDGLIVSSGSGHIKFWSMASTFTGLKLQGHVGKFGRTEISDITAFVSMPDGKVVSGSESGMLLLWEGNLIKCELGKAQPADETQPNCKCHAGAIHVVELVENGRLLVTGGADGYLRYWSIDEIDVTENSGSDSATAIKLLHETYVGDNVSIRCVTRTVDGQHWVLLDGNGAIRKTNYMTYDAVMHAAAGAVSTPYVDRAPLLRFNAGGVTAVAPSPTDHVAFTGGEDHTVRLIDYINKTEVYSVKFDAKVVHLDFIRIPGDTACRQLIATFSDGTVRLLRRAKNTVEVLSQQKPHASSIIAFAVDDNARQLWTIAKDRTAFYFKLTDGATVLDPVGFCDLPEEPRCCEFTASGDRLFVGFKSGKIITLAPPDESAIDRELGFKFNGSWEGVGIRQKAKPPEKEKKINPEGFEVMDASSSDDDLLADEEDQGPWPVNFLRRLPTGAVAVGLEQPELTYEYHLTTRYPNNAMGPPPLPPTGIEPAGRVEEPMKNLAYRDTIMRRAKLSWSKKTLLLLTEHSTVVMRPLKKIETCEHSCQLHDALDHKISDAAMSFDERVLLTVGLDGMLFAHELEGLEPPSAVDVATHDSVPVAAVSKVEPIAHSIQRQKELDDQRAAEEAALGKKERLLRKVRSVHAEFNRLLAENDDATGGCKVPEDELVLDPKVLEQLEEQKAKVVADAHLEHEWVSAKKATLMKKLKAAFVDTLQWERFELRGFSNGLVVSSFRAPVLTEAQRANLDKVRELLEADAAAIEPSAASDASGSPRRSPHQSPDGSPTQPSSAVIPPPEFTEYVDPEDSQYTEAKKSLGDSKVQTSSAVKSQLEKAEERKRERIARKRGMEELMGRNPQNLPEDADEIAAIERAANHMGNLKLKTDPDYSPDPHLQPTAQRKATQLILLESSINQLRCDFNQKVLERRDIKRRLCEQMNAELRRIREICEMLQEDCTITEFSLSNVEQPEKRFDIDKAGLEAFGMEQDKARRKAEALERAKKGFGSDLANIEDDDEPDSSKRRHSGAAASSAYAAAAAPPGLREKFEMDLTSRKNALRRSELEEEEWEMLREQLRHERARLERRIFKTIEAYDEELDELYHEKLELESDLCMADMRVRLLFREYLLLLDFRQKDQELNQRKGQKEKEASEAATLVRDCEKNLNSKRAEIQKADAIIEDLAQEFQEMIGELPKGALAEIEGVYTRKIKRRRFDDDDDDDDDDSSSSDDEDEDEDDYAEEGDDTCPNGVDEQTFAAVLALRERRLDQVDRKADVNKAIDKLTAEHERLLKRQTNCANQLRSVVDEVEAFKKEKQQRLNQLETIVVLKLSQIRCLDANNKFPADLTDDYVVFTQEGLRKLQQRIVDLAREREQLEVDTKALESEAQRLGRRKAKRVAEHADWESKVYEMQLLKFGQRVNLEMLENVAVDRETEELKAALKAEEVRWERELGRQNAALQDVKLDQQHRIAENTACLKDLGSFRAEQRDLEEALQSSAGKIVAKMTGGSKVATAADRAHLKDLVVAQQQEIDALKNEIAMLRRKGGHVYTPVVNKVAPPHPPASA